MCRRVFKITILSCVLMFSSGATQAWTVEESFDAQVVGEKCGTFWNDGANSTVSTEVVIDSASKSCKMAVLKGETTWGGGFVPPESLHKGDEVWIRFRLFIPQGFDFNAYSHGNRVKFIRMTVRDIVGTPRRLDWYWEQEGSIPPFAKTLESDACTTDCWEKFGTANDVQVRGTWETYEMYAKFDHVSVNDGGDGRVRIWKNGRLIGDLTDRPTMWGNSSEVSSFMIFSHWNGGSPKTQHLYFDDLITTNEVPGSKDASGNPFIGVGSYAYVAPPNSPAGLSKQ